MIVAIGTDAQFARFCREASLAELLEDPRFTTNPQRVRHRDALTPVLAEAIARRPVAEWLELMERVGVPGGPVRTIPEVFEHAPFATQTHEHATLGPIRTVRSPIGIDGARRTADAPPPLSAHTPGRYFPRPVTRRRMSSDCSRRCAARTTEEARMATHLAIDELRTAGVRSVRLEFPDLHGIVRGREIPIADFPGVVEDGAGFVEATMTIDLHHNIVSGFASGFRDLLARPDLDTLATLPWAPDTAICLCDLEDTGTHGPSGLDPRGALRRAIEGYREIELEPVLGPELEFHLCEPGPVGAVGLPALQNVPSRVYTTGPAGDPRRVLPRLLRGVHDLGLGAFAGNHEYGRGEFEINLHHGDALEATDRAFRFKCAIKELAALEGLLATFIGKPWNDDEGSGFHLHTSLRGRNGENAFVDAEGPTGSRRCAATSSPG